jgi:RHS repeat-associated protein
LHGDFKGNLAAMLRTLISVRDVLAGRTDHPAASFDYDPYGNPTRTKGLISTDFRYAGMFYEQNSGLYLTQYRPYDSRSGRWLSRDPIGESGGVNLYGYVGENPVTYTDSLGLACSPSPTPPELSDQALSAIDTVLAEIQAAAQAAGKSALDFITTTIEPTLSGAFTDVGGVLLNLEKGLLDPGVLAGVKALLDQSQNPENPSLNYGTRRQLCELFPADCPAAPKPAAPKP